LTGNRGTAGRSNLPSPSRPLSPSGSLALLSLFTPQQEATSASAIASAIQPGVKTLLTRDQFKALAPYALETIFDAALYGHPSANHFIAALDKLKVRVTKSDESEEYLWCVGRVSDIEGEDEGSEVHATLKRSGDGSKWQLAALPAMREAVDKGKGKEAGLVIEKTPPGFATAHTELTEEIKKRVLNEKRLRPLPVPVPELLEHKKLLTEAEKKGKDTRIINRIKRGLSELEYRRVSFSFLAANPELARSLCSLRINIEDKLASVFHELFPIAYELGYTTSMNSLVVSRAVLDLSERRDKAAQDAKGAYTENSPITYEQLIQVKERLRKPESQRAKIPAGGTTVLGADEHQELERHFDGILSQRLSICRALLAEIEARGVCLSLFIKHPELVNIFLENGLRYSDTSFGAAFNILVPLAQKIGIGSSDDYPEWQPVPVREIKRKPASLISWDTQASSGVSQHVTLKEGQHESAGKYPGALKWEHWKPEDEEDPFAKRSKANPPEK